MGHIPVMLRESVSGLRVNPDGIYLDGTLGCGGHTLEIASKLDTGFVVAVDRDSEAIERAAELLPQFPGKIRAVREDFRNIPDILDEMGIEAVDGMLFDLGVSSPQLDTPERGFSYTHDAPLDMRMDQSESLSAFEVVNSFTFEELRDILYKYGEERRAGLIARAIVKKRGAAPVKTTLELVNVIISALPPQARREKQHPAKRTFQALRIAVNRELESIGDLMKVIPSRLKTGGRVCVISFHSLEDRLIKDAFAAQSKGCVCPDDFPVCVCGIRPSMKLITKKPIVAQDGEIERNPRARSAKLRIAERAQDS